MTSPGGGEIIVSPDDNYRHVATRRNQAADFFTDKPPDIPADPNDPTKGATDDLTGAVQGTSHGFGHHSNGVADGVENATNNHVNRDQDNAGLLAGLGGGGGAQKQAATGLTDVGVGSIMNSVLNPTGAITGAFEQALGGFSQAAGGFGQAGGNILGQSLNASIKLADAPKPPDGGPGPGGTIGGGAKLAGASAGASEAPATRPVSGTTPLNGAPATTPGGGSDYGHTELQDRNNPTVRPAGMAMGGMPIGLGASGGGPASAAKPLTYRIITGNGDYDPANEPIPEVVDPGIAAPPASVSVPLRKGV